jgi:flagellar assembly factor FliW
MPTVTTKRFGDLAYSSEDVVHFPAGLVGLPELRRWIVLDAGGNSPLRWFQSLDRWEFSFPVLPPEYFRADYQVDSGRPGLPGDIAAAEHRTLIITTVQPGGGVLTGNLLAPLVIDMASRRGVQVTLDDERYGVSHEIDYVKFGLAENTDSSDNGRAAGSAREGKPAGPEAVVETPEPAGV